MNKKTLLAVTLISLVSIVLLYFSYATPEGARVTYVSNTTKNASAPESRQDNKGTITTLLLNIVQQNFKWKAYVGNVSGTLVLRDADQYSIYEWPSGGSPDGEVYITRFGTVDWDVIGCANSSSITGEQTTLGHAAAAADNINNTFSGTKHARIDVGTNPIANSTCRALTTRINNTAQTDSESALFQEVILQENTTARLIYVTLIDQNSMSYKNASTNMTYDFQALVPDYTTSSTATYYFFVEIEG